MSCCQRATPDEIDQEPEAYDCETCPWRTWRARLGPEIQQALLAYSLLSSRVVQDLHLVPVVFDALGLAMTRTEILRLLDRLARIHEVRCPASPRDLGLTDGE